MVSTILGHSVDEWKPLPPTEGIPLPVWIDSYLPFRGYWPWYKAPAGVTTGTLIITLSPASTVLTVNGNQMVAGTFPDVEPGEYDWTADADGYTSKSGTVSVVAGEITTLNVSLSAVSGGGTGGGGGTGYDFGITGTFNQNGVNLVFTNNDLNVTGSIKLSVISVTLHDKDNHSTQVNTGGPTYFTMPTLGNSVPINISFNQASLNSLISSGAIDSDFNMVTLDGIASYSASTNQIYQVYTGDGTQFYMPFGGQTLIAKNPPPLPDIYRQ